MDIRTGPNTGTERLRRTPCGGRDRPDQIQTRTDLTGQLIVLFHSSGKTLRGVADVAKLGPATVSGIVNGTTGIPHVGTLKESWPPAVSSRDHGSLPGAASSRTNGRQDEQHRRFSRNRN